MDNAGGQGTKEAKEEFEKILFEEFNVIIEWQIANSPETNMLDLGGWMAVQSDVDTLHKFKVMKADALHTTIKNAFFNLSETTLDKIHSRWVKVLDLIIKGHGDNVLVEAFRGDNQVVIDLTSAEFNNKDQEPQHDDIDDSENPDRGISEIGEVEDGDNDIVEIMDCDEEEDKEESNVMDELMLTW